MSTVTGAELRVVMRWLGLSAPALAAVLGVTERTVRHWLAEVYAVPDGVRLDVERIEAATAVAVGDVVDGLHDARDVGVFVYRTDEAMWAARPESHPYPRSWWDQVVARAVTEVPGVVIEYAPEP